MTALIYCTFPDEKIAMGIGRTLIDEKLIACINIGGAIRSLFSWRGETDEGEEIAAVLKTDRALLEQAIARLEDLHPYDTPAILGWHCDAAGSATQAWLGELT
ncbi:MAG: divalent-cation tolerance protein CutA [Erythrobacter sp.]